VLNVPIKARLYLPPCYGALDQRYPVLYMLHGRGFTEDQWERLGVITATHTLLASGELEPFIIVLPRDPGELYDVAFANDIVPYIDKTYHTIPDRAGRAIGGLSRGAGWAVRIGLKYPQLFSRIGLHSVAVFYGDEYDLIDWTQHRPKDQPLKVYIDVGEGDREIQSSAWLDQIFTWFQVDHQYSLRPGGHSERYWAKHVGEYVRFYAGEWKQAP
jgi:enterochelin esterase-like enzyme